MENTVVKLMPMHFHGYIILNFSEVSYTYTLKTPILPSVLRKKIMEKFLFLKYLLIRKEKKLKQ
ncbi:MAG TPA: hypothetical protein DHV28_15250 [Ignavibacteriales bacterium]|nr:hypothetical protein [Ignavibacteriales bacterium]